LKVGGVTNDYFFLPQTLQLSILVLKNIRIFFELGTGFMFRLLQVLHFSDITAALESGTLNRSM
jgi:hypothetical protein